VIKMESSLRYFINRKCPNKGYWCNGQHIPIIKKTTYRDKSRNTITIFGDEDLSKKKDKKPCYYYKKNRCTHPNNPKNK